MRSAALFPWVACAAGLWAAVPKIEIRLDTRAGLEENRGQAPAQYPYLLRQGPPLDSKGQPFIGDAPLLEFVDGNPAPSVAATSPLPGVVNVVKGRDPANWITGIRRFREIRFGRVYPGIDVAYRIVDSAPYPMLQLAWIVSAGADPSAVRLRARTPPGWVYVSMAFPLTAFQGEDAARAAIPVSWREAGPDEGGFTVGSYDRTRELVIEIVLAPAQVIPGWNHDIGGTGAVTATGRLPADPRPVQLGTFPDGDVCGRFTMRGTTTLVSCNDAFVARYSSSGALEYLTFLGGSANDGGERVKTDAEGNVWLAGVTNSVDFPITPDASQPAFAGPIGVLSTSPSQPHLEGDLFLMKLGRTGLPVYSTYFGGPRSEWLAYFDRLLVDSAGNVIVAGFAGGPDPGGGAAGLPVTPNAYRKTTCDLCSFAAKWTKQGRLSYVTYIPSQGFGYDVDASGALYFGGIARADAPVTPGAYRTVYGGGDTDGYIGKLNPAGSALMYGTFVTGSGDANTSEAASQIAVDSKGNAWFTCCGFLGKLDPSGARLLVRLNHAGGETAIDRQDNVHLVGTGTSGGPPAVIQGGAIAATCGHSFYAKLDPQGVLQYFESSELTWHFAGFDASGRPVVLSDSTPPSLDATRRFLTLDLSNPPRRWLSCLVNSASLTGREAVVPGEIVSLFGAGLGPQTGAQFSLDADSRAPRQLAGTRVLFDGVAAPVLWAQHGQVNAIAPFSLTPGASTRVELDYDGARFELPVKVIDSRPAFFTTSGSQRGQAAALNQDGSVNSPSNPARRGSVVSLFLTGAGRTEPKLAEGEVARNIGPVLVTPFQVGLLHAPGWTPLQIEYAGPAPGLLNSVAQLNVRLPESIPPSAFPLAASPLVLLVDGTFLYQYAEIAIQ